MDIYEGVYRYTDYNGKQRIVPIERVYWIRQLQRGDHIALLRYAGLYWHHAIVEDVDTQNGEIHVIAYTKRDNSSHGRRQGKLKVQRKKHNLHDDPVYLIKHEECLPAETVVDTARFCLDEGGYDLLTNNCEHFALWCKTEISSSEQVKSLKERFTKAVSFGGQAIMDAGTHYTTREVFTHTASKAGEEIVTKGTRVTTKGFVTQTTTQTGSEAGGSLLGGVICAAAIEGASIMYDIYCAGEEMRKGKLSKDEFDRAVGKRIVGGVGSVAGTTAGAAIGQVLIPVPILGGFIGGGVGGLFGRFLGDTVADSA